MHFYYHYKNEVANQALSSPLLHEILEMFKRPNEQESATGLVYNAMGDQVSYTTAFFVPIFIAIVFGALSIGILSLLLSMDQMDLKFDRTMQLRLRIFVPIATFLFTLLVSYLYFCFFAHSRSRHDLFEKANTTFRMTTYEIF